MALKSTKASNNSFLKDTKEVAMPIISFLGWLFYKLSCIKLFWNQMNTFYKHLKIPAYICSAFYLGIRRIRTRKIFVLIITISISVLFLIRYGHQLKDLFKSYRGEKPCFTPNRERNNLRYMIHSFHTVMSKYELVYWIDFGTLLGAIRYEDIIPWDYDGDIGYLNSDLPKMKMFVVPDLRNKYGVNANKDDLVQMDHNGTIVDLFRYTTYALLKNVTNPPRHSNSTLTRSTNRHGRWLESYFDTEKELALPPSKCLFAGRYVNCPAKPNKILRHRYPNTVNNKIPYKLQCWLPWNLWKIWFHKTGKII